MPGVLAHRSLLGVALALQMGGNKGGGDITGISFEMVRGSVYSAAADESELRGGARGRGGG